MGSRQAAARQGPPAQLALELDEAVRKLRLEDEEKLKVAKMEYAELSFELGEYYEKKLTKWRERVDSFFARVYAYYRERGLRCHGHGSR
mgnify:CR=1 FL=1